MCRLLIALALVLALGSPGLAGGSAPPARVAELVAESQRLQLTNPKAGLAKAEEALALLSPGAHAQSEATLLLSIARLYTQEGRLDDALKAIQRAEPLARAGGLGAVSRGLRVARALALTLKGQPEEARSEGERALAEAKAAGDVENQIEALSLLGEVEGTTGNYPKGIGLFHEALDLAEKPGQLAQRGMLLLRISTFHTRTREFEKALEYNHQASVIADQRGDLNHLAVLRINAAYLLGRLNRLEEELTVLLEAEALVRRINNARQLVAVENNITDFLIKRKDYAGALKRAVPALDEARRLGNPRQVAVALVNRGIALNRLGQARAGLASLEEGLEVCHNAKAASYEVDILGVLSEEYAFAGKLQKALDCHRAFKEKSDQLYNDARAKAEQELRARYQSEKQNREIAQLKGEAQRRTLVRNFSVLGALLVLALALALLARYRLLRRSSAQLEALNDQLVQLSLTDPLTGLRNRRYFTLHVGQDTLQADRSHRGAGPLPENPDLVFFLVDLDHFIPI